MILLLEQFFPGCRCFAAMFEGRMLRQEAHLAVQRNVKAAI